MNPGQPVDQGNTKQFLAHRQPTHALGSKFEKII
jgi:hypothetical protein